MATKRVLIIGADTHGSYQVRGLQLGGAIGARVTTRPMASDWSWADVVVLLKRAHLYFADAARRCGAPVVWDAVDYWTQPEQNAQPIGKHVIQAQRIAQHLGAVTVITATQAMATAIGTPACVYLPHHSRPGLKATPIRPLAKTVAYEGAAKYLGTWRVALEQSCARLGLTFVVNPESLSTADVVVAFRGERWDGDVCRQWKSGVKYVNALAAGRPVVTQRSNAAFGEIKPAGASIETTRDLDQALEYATAEHMRTYAMHIADQRAHEYSLASIAERYETILQSAGRRAA